MNQNISKVSTSKYFSQLLSIIMCGVQLVFPGVIDGCVLITTFVSAAAAAAAASRRFRCIS